MITGTKQHTRNSSEKKREKQIAQQCAHQKLEHGVLTFKLSKIGDVHYVYRPANQDQEQTIVVQRGFKGSQRPSETTWMVAGLKWQQRVLGWVGEPAGLAGTS